VGWAGCVDAIFDRSDDMQTLHSEIVVLFNPNRSLDPEHILLDC